MHEWMGIRTSRRQFLSVAGGGLRLLAIAAMQSSALPTGKVAPPKHPLAPKPPHFEPKAKRVLWLFMHGGPSHVDLFDPKSDLQKYAGQPLPDSFGDVMTRRKVAKNPLLAPVKPFKKYGNSGVEVSDFLPHIAQHADKLCVIRSMHGDSVNHPQSVYQMNTGNILMGHPSVGSWVTYGLGTENQDMPSFIVMTDKGGGIKGGPPGLGQWISAGNGPRHDHAHWRATDSRSRPAARHFQVSTEANLRSFANDERPASRPARR